MAKFNDRYDMSQLEQGFEMEIDEASNVPSDHELEANFEAFAGEEDPVYEYEEDYESTEDEPLEEWEMDDLPMTYAERLFELSQREFENEFELDRELNEILHDMEREYFFGFLKKIAGGVKKAVSSVGKTVGSLINKGKKVLGGVVSKIPGFSALRKAVGPLLGSLRGMLGSAAKSGLAGLIPGGQAALSALNALGLNSEMSDEERIREIEKFVAGAKRAYEFAAENIHANVDNPIEAHRLASRAFEAGMNVMQGGSGKAKRHGRIRDGARVIRLKESPGNEIRSILIKIEK